MGVLIRVDFSTAARSARDAAAVLGNRAEAVAPRPVPAWDASWELPARSGSGFAWRGWRVVIWPSGLGGWCGTCTYFTGGGDFPLAFDLRPEDTASAAAWRALGRVLAEVGSDAPVQKA